MKELIPIEADNLPIEVEQSAVPIPAEGKRLYITQDTKGIDFHLTMRCSWFWTIMLSISEINSHSCTTVKLR